MVSCGCDRMVVGFITTHICNQCLSPLNPTTIRSQLRRSPFSAKNIDSCKYMHNTCKY